MAPVASGRGSVWVGGLGSWTDQSARSGIDGYKYDAGGYAVGADCKLSSSALAGVAIGQSYGTFQDKGGLSSYDCGLLHGHALRPLHARRGFQAGPGRLAAFGTTSFDGKAAWPDTSASGKFDSDSFGAAVYATWTEQLRSKLVIAPFARAGIHDREDGQLLRTRRPGPDL